MRLSRNTSMYLPFWVAIPVWLIWAAIMVVVVWGMILGLSYGAKGAVTLSRRATRAAGERQARCCCTALPDSWPAVCPGPASLGGHLNPT